MAHLRAQAPDQPTSTVPRFAQTRADFQLAAHKARGYLRQAGIWLDLVLLLPVLALAAVFLLPRLDAVPANSDEGIRLQQLFLMTAGFRPVRDIVASQGPLSLNATYPFFIAFGGDLQAARLAVVIYALVGLAAVYLCGRIVGGPLAGLVAALLLALSPTYLQNSRTALVEVPALVPAVLAVAAAFRHRAVGSPPALIASFVLLILAILVKPIVAPAAAAILAATLPRASRRPALLLLAISIGCALVVAVVLIAGPRELYEQVLLLRLGSRRAEGWSLAQNWGTLLTELRREGAGWLVLTILGVVLSLWQRRDALPPLLWTAATVALLLVYSPLMEKHAVVLILPVALMVGVSLARAAAGLPSLATAPARLLLGAALGAGALAYLASAPAILARDRGLSITAGDARDDRYADDVALLAALAGPDEFVIVDEPYLAFLARRMVPPSLADPTSFRLRSGTLSGSEVIAVAQRYPVRTMLLWSDGLRDLKPFGAWVDENFHSIKIYERANRKDRALLVRGDYDSGSARELARGSLAPMAVDFVDQLRLAAAGLDGETVRAGAPLTVGSEWEALGSVSVDYHVVAFLRAADGRAVAQIERSLGGGGAGTAGWRPGRWVIRVANLVVPPRTPPGEYRVSLGLYDSRSRQTLPLANRPASGPVDEAPVGAVRVR